MRTLFSPEMLPAVAMKGLISLHLERKKKCMKMTMGGCKCHNSPRPVIISTGVRFLFFTCSCNKGFRFYYSVGYL